MNGGQVYSSPCRVAIVNFVPCFMKIITVTLCINPGQTKTALTRCVYVFKPMKNVKVAEFEPTFTQNRLKNVPVTVTKFAGKNVPFSCQRDSEGLSVTFFTVLKLCRHRVNVITIVSRLCFLVFFCENVIQSMREVKQGYSVDCPRSR